MEIQLILLVCQFPSQNNKLETVTVPSQFLDMLTAWQSWSVCLLVSRSTILIQSECYPNHNLNCSFLACEHTKLALSCKSISSLFLSWYSAALMTHH